MAYEQDESQNKAARLAGFLYLLTTVAAIFGDFYVRRRLMVPGDALQTGGRIAASEPLFLGGIAGDLITVAAQVVLIVALVVVLRPIKRSLALIAASWWLLECFLFAVNTSINYTTLLVVKGSGSMPAAGNQPLPFLLSFDMAGNRIAALFFGLGSTLFCYLWFRSCYIPRVLAAWGILSSLVPIVAPLTTMMAPALHDVPLRRARTGWPIITFHVIAGLWLLVRGIRTNKQRAVAARSS